MGNRGLVGKVEANVGDCITMYSNLQFGHGVEWAVVGYVIAKPSRGDTITLSQHDPRRYSPTDFKIGHGLREQGIMARMRELLRLGTQGTVKYDLGEFTHYEILQERSVPDVRLPA